MSLLPVKLTEEKIVRAHQTYVLLPGVGYCPINYWVEEEVKESVVLENKGSSKWEAFKKLGLVSVGILLGIMVVNLRLG